MVDPLAGTEVLARIDAGAVATLVSRLGAASQQMRALGTWIKGVPGLVRGWTGAGYDSFVRTVDVVGLRICTAGDALGVAAAALSALAVVLESLQQEVSAAQRVLRAAGPTDPVHAVAAQLTDVAGRFRVADQRCAGLLADALLLDLSRGLGRPRGAQVSVAVAAAELTRDVSGAPPPPASPQAVAVWWAGLSPAAHVSAEVHWPGWPAGLDGVPAGVRDAINRRRLAAALHDARVAYAAVPLAQNAAHLAARARLRRLETLSAAAGPSGSQLLLFDPSGDGEAVVATADVETSRAVAVLVPGMRNELDDVGALTLEARRLAGAAGPGTAAIAWLGYDTPNLRQAISDRAARPGAQQLERFVLGLRSTAARLQHVTVLGHSYGSLVAGLAARRARGADDLVLLASPGVEAHRASQLQVPAGHVWVARDATDPIQLVFVPSRVAAIFGIEMPTVFGPDPAGAAFGARHVAVGGAFGHSGYFTAGSQSLASLAAIVSGRAEP